MAGKKFRFSLAQVLKLRRHETEAAQQKLAAAEAEREAAAARLQGARQRLDACRGAERGQALRPARLRQAEAFRQDGQRRVTKAREQLAACHEKVDAARAAVRERRQAQEGLEKLREREANRHAAAQKKAEAAFLDEQAVLRYGRSSALTTRS